MNEATFLHLLEPSFTIYSLKPLVLALGVAMIGDFLLGIGLAICEKSPHTKEGRLSSRVMHRGLLRKMATIIALAFIYLLDQGLATSLFPLCVSAFLIQEGLSLLENLKALDIPLPEAVKNLLERHK